MRVLGIDQSFGAGFACLGHNHMETWRNEAHGATTIERHVDTGLWVERAIDCALANHIEVLIIARERPSYHSKSRATSSQAALAGMIDWIVSNRMDATPSICAYYEISPSTFKKLILGKGNIAKDSGYLLKVFDKTGVRFLNDDEADAYMIAKTAKRMEEIRSRVVSELTEEDFFLLCDEKLKVFGCKKTTKKGRAGITLDIASQCVSGLLFPI